MNRVKAVYVSIGAAVFSELERNYEKEMCAGAETEFKNFTDNLIHTDNGRYIITDDELIDLIRHVEKYSADGLSVADYNTTGCPDLWTYSGALYFCFTIGTTVGYGDTAPNTFNGRLFFIFYVVPGICICGALIAEIGRLMYNALERGRVIIYFN